MTLRSPRVMRPMMQCRSLARLRTALAFLTVSAGHDDDEADAHVEGAQHLVLRDVAEVLQVLEEGRDGPSGEIDDGAHALGQDAGEVLGDAAAGDVGHAAHDCRRGELLDDGEVAAVGAHEGGAGLVLELVDVLLGAVFGDLEEQLASERVAVGVEAVGGQADEDVADLDVLAGDDLVAVDAPMMVPARSYSPSA